jgi:hypothetical protein
MYLRVDGIREDAIDDFSHYKEETNYDDDDDDSRNACNLQ